MVSNILRVSLIVSVLSLNYACSTCPDEIEVVSELSLNTSAKDLLGILDADSIMFEDQFGDTVVFEAVNHISGFEKVLQEANGLLCDNGSRADAIYFAEKHEKTYVSLNRDSKIEISLFSWNPNLILTEDEIISEPSTGRDILEIEIIEEQCDTLFDSRFVQFSDGSSNVLQGDVPFFKFGNRYENIFSIGVLFYPGSTVLSKDRGIVAFETCNHSYAQVLR